GSLCSAGSTRDGATAPARGSGAESRSRPGGGAFPICTAKPENPGFRLDFGRGSARLGSGRSMPYTCGTPLVNALVASGGGVLDPNELLGELENSFAALARGDVQCPPRPQISVPVRGFSLAMAAWQPGMQICVKVVNVFDGNLKLGLPNHLAIINLFDPDTG